MTPQPHPARAAPAVTDLAVPARIRMVAMGLFARRGFVATTVRDIARAAEMSPGRVQHHFPSKNDLRAAVDAYVAGVFHDFFAHPSGATATHDLSFGELGQQITALVRDHPVVVSYVVRSAADGDAAGGALVDEIVQVAHTQIRDLQDRGLVRGDVDVEWASLSIVIMSMSTLTFQRSVERIIGRPFFDATALNRWNAAATTLFERGIGTTSDPTSRTTPDETRRGRRTGAP